MLFPIADVVVNPLLLLLLGLIVGTLSGFFGVGGGFLITGGLLVFGIPPIFAVGTGITLIMGSSLINMLKHRSLGNVDYRLGLLTLGGTVPALLIAERVNASLEAAGIAGPVLRSIYVVFLAGLGLFIVFDYWWTHRGSRSGPAQVSTAGFARLVQSARIPPHSIKVPGLPAVPTYVSLPVSGIDRMSVFILLAVGFGVGFMAGLLGAGGGFILLPILIYVLGVPTTVAVGTGLLQIIATGSVGTFIYSLSNHVDPVMAVIMLVAAAIGAQLGAPATRFVRGARIRLLFGLTILNGSLAVGLEQAAHSAPRLAFLSTVASVLLLSVSGAICLLVVALLIVGMLKKPVVPQTGG